ncbi:hypothetical protein [Cupriavidus pampae]|uniref:Uncharacterized protein n=1 Tax=Cupriavidus pampae TaxID=659251 RepID=A0ABM8Y286_9BURK|nr:hypothetical protein [Cupriavidus pampae]CAG9186861.1 hypothetical protein LMG32289_06665 [Cupriavidus pampae]
MRELQTPGADGILGHIESRHIAKAVALLPAAATATQEHLDVEVDTEAYGKVRFFAERTTIRHRRRSHFFWSVYRAEPIRSNDAL